MTSAGNKLFTVFGGGPSAYSFSDSDAEAYAALVELEGVVLTDAHKRELDGLVADEKTAGTWSTYGRFILPIWGNAAANAIDLVTLGSGSYSGTVTHEAGYVQGDGSTGYFDFGVSPDTLGFTSSNAHLAAFIIQADSRNATKALMGCSDFANRRALLEHVNSTAARAQLNWAGAIVALNPAGDMTGVFSAILEAEDSRTLTRCDSDGNVTSGTATASSAIGPSVANAYGLGANYNGTLTNPSDARIGMMALGDKITAAQSSAFVQRMNTRLRALLALASLLTFIIPWLTLGDGLGGSFVDGIGNTLRMT